MLDNETAKESIVEQLDNLIDYFNDQIKIRDEKINWLEDEIERLKEVKQ
jgi:hypothetical protein